MTGQLTAFQMNGASLIRMRIVILLNRFYYDPGIVIGISKLLGDFDFTFFLLA